MHLGRFFGRRIEERPFERRLGGRGRYPGRLRATARAATREFGARRERAMRALDQLCVNTLRFLAVDMVEQAQSGHPGLPLGAAPMAYVIWDRFLRHNPRDPKWFNRDRFILSPGHGCALLYALLHVTGYDLPLGELRRFRQWGSRTPGHPEYGLTPGVEATTGPLGQGFAMGVGMAMAEQFLERLFNRDSAAVIDHWTYGIVSDGDLMEGVASEAASLAGRLRLGKLIYLYDDNHISIEGPTDLAFTEDVQRRFEAYGWRTLRVADGEDLDAIETAIRAAQAPADRPSLILVRTHIGYGSPKQDSAAAHGEPLGPDAARETKLKLGWPSAPPFHVPPEAAAHFQKAQDRGARAQAAWDDVVESLGRRRPDLGRLLAQAVAGDPAPEWDADLPTFGGAPMATRDASSRVMAALADRLPTFVGGAADLAPSTKTTLAGRGDFDGPGEDSRNIHFGVREHAMGGCVNGMALHGGVIPFGATFLVFSDYMRPAIRLAALMQTHSIFVFSHDSIGLGEDGPTHQPVEHLMALRAIPGLTLVRPADANETAVAWRIAVQRRRPIVLVLTRQKLPVLDPARHPIAEGAPRGGYILEEADAGRPDIVLVASGSEVHLIFAAREQLEARGVRVRVVSMPSFELFDEQPDAYRRAVLPPEAPTLAVEAGISRGWREYVGGGGAVIGLDRFGASAPGAVAMEQLGFNVQHVVTRALALIRR